MHLLRGKFIGIYAVVLSATSLNSYVIISILTGRYTFYFAISYQLHNTIYVVII